MVSAVASKEVPKPVFLMDILASPSASGRKTVASAGRLFNTGGAPPRCSDDGVKDSTGEDAALSGGTPPSPSSSPEVPRAPRVGRFISLPLISSNLASEAN